MLYDVIIAGGGPAGVSAGIYSARKRLKTLFITTDFGGQSVVSPEIQNWIGTKAISGNDLAKQLEDHLRNYEGDSLTVLTGQKVANLEREAKNFKVTTGKGEAFIGRTVLITTGSTRRRLNALGADTYDQKGLTYCASCDGPLFTDQDVVVIGGGNAGFETAGQLLAYTKSVTLLHRSPEFKADAITVEKLSKNPRFHALTNIDILEIKGDKFVNGIVFQDKLTGEKKELPVKGVFVEVGFTPNTDFAKSLIELDNFGAIVVDAKNQKTGLAGIWSAGDCTNALYHQNNIASGDGIKAIEDIYTYLHLK